MFENLLDCLPNVVNTIVFSEGYKVINPIPLDILRFRAKITPLIKWRQQGGAKFVPTRGE